jgi:hypothetical protein
VSATPGDVLHRFGQMPVNDGLRSESNFAVFKRRFQQIPNVQTHPLTDALGNNDLKFGFYRDQFHDQSSLDSLTVGLSNSKTVLPALTVSVLILDDNVATQDPGEAAEKLLNSVGGRLAVAD